MQLHQSLALPTQLQYYKGTKRAITTKVLETMPILLILYIVFFLHTLVRCLIIISNEALQHLVSNTNKTF